MWWSLASSAPSISLLSLLHKKIIKSWKNSEKITKDCLVWCCLLLGPLWYEMWWSLASSGHVCQKGPDALMAIHQLLLIQSLFFSSQLSAQKWQKIRTWWVIIYDIIRKSVLETYQRWANKLFPLYCIVCNVCFWMTQHKIRVNTYKWCFAKSKECFAPKLI